MQWKHVVHSLTPMLKTSSRIRAVNGGIKYYLTYNSLSILTCVLCHILHVSKCYYT